ncbi:class I SAM-dependent methyltransferase [Mycobacterium sp. SMC-13]|uniref:class I SAM-dependent methyltransferase n=1 Tax=Mycobacterium sp. SMC-13 TaxID=3381626 RepID=UPI0038760706
MAEGGQQRGVVERSQDIAHGHGHDYTIGSPHLRHAALRKRIDERIEAVVRRVVQRKGTCAVLEIGAGHGSFTDVALAAGGAVTVTEMSRASYDYLSAKFSGVADVKVVYDADGNAPFDGQRQYDVILLISVIHHIPDYFGVIERLCDEVLHPGGVIVTFQDPVWYPRQTRWARVASSGSYLAWRLTQGEFRRGLRTRWRRLRGVYSESEPSDLVEYHVVRQGVDDKALGDLLGDRFESVEFDTYFSTQSSYLQAIGEKLLPHNTFGVVASGYRSSAIKPE